ncbi:MAG: SPOR domain-containing protein [Paracoccaceae bacterium]
MADIDFDHYGDIPRISGGQAQRLIHLAGAVCSLALVMGLGLWGYRLAVRDVTGVPVIRAIEGPMRVAPSNPGGDIADHQGMAINVIAAVGGAGAMPQEIVLAPAPVELSVEDAPGLSALVAPEVAVPDPKADALKPLAVAPAMGADASLAPVASGVLADSDAGVMALGGEGVDREPTTPVPLTTEDAVALALAEALADETAPLDAQVDPQAEAVGTPASGLARSPRPLARPTGRLAGVTGVEQISAAAFSVPEIDASTLAVGTRLVQLGAFDSADLARGEWIKLTGRFGDLMSGKSVVIQSAQSGGRTFYRLRAHGFEGEDDARRFCSALLAESAACIPVAHR